MGSSPPALPELGSDADEDEQLRYAIALSLQDTTQAKGHGSDENPALSTDEKSEGGGTIFGSLALNRKQMEEERLRRLSKKRRAPSDNEDDDDVIEIPPPKKLAVNAQLQTTGSVPFPRGVVKRTWARGYPRTPDDIKIEEIWNRHELMLAVLSSFQWDEEWIMSKLDMRKTKLLLLAYAGDEAQKETMRTNAPPGIKFCFPRMNGPGSMHSKLQLLKYPNYLRVVVPTGNLVPYDWGESGVMENMVFIIDLPRLPNPKEHRSTRFSTELGNFLAATGVEPGMVHSLNNYDFSRTEQLGFVYTIPGGHSDKSMTQNGYCGLGASVAALGLATDDPVEVDLTCASLGSLNHDFIHAIYYACQGDDGMKEFKSRASRNKGSGKATHPSAQIQDHFRIYFPTERTVRQSKGGTPAAGTICFQEKWWRSPTFPRQLVRDCINTRTGLLMHSKLIFVRSARRASTEGPKGLGWAYVGSANLSESAWGRIVRDRASGKAKLTCRNWECGVVVPVAGPETSRAKTADGDFNSNKTGNNGQSRGGGECGRVEMSVFSGAVPVPMQVPAPRYEAGDEPWLFLNA
ncbi:ubiquitin interaction domain-containing protein [Stachybotrys elegans]|uniref:Ubiquitin interaction domain-containing protein n=1 Tax=Stachybotrys elegans TaxID=80388 RepID=A0A8K0WM58_9HYPO|nr:ubiquitin interaction domain-containing protein [Stachybotrys elegans]